MRVADNVMVFEREVVTDLDTETVSLSLLDFENVSDTEWENDFVRLPLWDFVTVVEVDVDPVVDSVIEPVKLWDEEDEMDFD